MKNQIFKRIFSLMTASVITVSTMGITAFAEGDSLTVSDAKIPLTKSIIFFNDDNTTVYEPNITFNYGVTPVTVEDGETTVTDRSNNSIQVYSGVADGVSGTSIAFSANHAASASANGTKIENKSELTVDTNKFDHAGVYRYLITESNNDVTSVGMTARTEGYQATRYLDVYLKNTSSGIELYGAIIFKSVTTNGQNSVNTQTDKTSGFEPEKEPFEYKNDDNVDKYTTYNIEVKKVVDGSLADKTHEFPFYVSLTNSITGAKYTYDNKGSETAETISAAAVTKGNDEKTSALKLKHNDSIKFIGVPSSQSNDLSIDVKEWNDTFDAYTASVSFTNGSASVSNGEMAANSDTPAQFSAFDVKTNSVAGQIMTITNTIKDISPTGIVLRFAPFAIMAGFGVLFLILSHKHHKKDNDNII